MNVHKRIAELRDDQRRLAELQVAEEQALRDAVDQQHIHFLAGRVKERARRLRKIEQYLALLLDISAEQSRQARRDTTDGRPA